MMGPIKHFRRRDRDTAENAGVSALPSGNAEHTIFSEYEVKPRLGKDRFALSVVLHTAAAVLLLEIASLPSAHVQPINYSKATPLMAPVPPARVKKIIAPPQRVMAKMEPPKLVAPQPPKVEEIAKVPPPVVKPELKKEVFPVVAEVVKPAPPKKEIITNTFASGSSVPATLQKPARAVQTGGFGDEQGVRGTSDKGQLRVAALGSFDLPGGPGQGNGTGGARGAKGTIASAGFGDGVAGPGNGDHGRRGQVAQTAFDQTAALGGPKVKPVSAKPAAITPVEILFKPRPVYTDEARRLHVEGEVLMAVTFTADGRLGDFRVVRGLGHGLDEAAQRAAAQIKFRPAKQNGQPLDSTAYVHIVFELAE